jgi:predicted alpha/beta superfamily hydrolase
MTGRAGRPKRFWIFALGAMMLSGGITAMPGCSNSSEPEVLAPEPDPPGNPEITFHITVPAGTPESDSVFVSGNRPELGTWDGHGLRAARRAAGVYEASVSFPDSVALEFKITRGGWETVEKGPTGEEVPNRTHLVAGDDTLDITVANWRDWTEGGPRPHTLTGDIRLHENVPSAFLARARNVIVYLPPGYADEPQRRYPVLYMHDGQNIFDEATSFIGIEWGVDETAERLIRDGAIPPIIVVGVYNTEDRVSEYTPVADPAYGGGQADAYGRFLIEELKPFIDATYRTRPEREHTGVAGSSLGGLVSMYFALTHGDVFSRIGVVSPAVWWADADILDRVAAAEKVESRIWVDVGTAESTGSTGAQIWVDQARALRDALLAKGWALGDDLAYLEDPGAGHNEAAWAGRMEAILRFLYPLQP